MIEIIPNQFDFGSLQSRTYTRRVIIHHSASPDVSASVIHDWHRRKDWSGIGYHAVIRADGAVEAGRPLDAVGAHAGSAANPDSIGICLTGNFMMQPPSRSQMDSLARLLDYLEDRYGTRLEVLRHKDVATTDCPGIHFPWPESSWLPVDSEVNAGLPETVPITWKDSLVSEARACQLITDNHHPDDPAPKWFVLAVGLNIMKGMGKIDAK